MSGKLKYEFAAPVWQYTGKGAWYFVSLPGSMAKEIRNALRLEEEGWGRLKATAEIGRSKWDTAIWFDSKMKTYVLPVKAVIRARENIATGDLVQVNILL